MKRIKLINEPKKLVDASTESFRSFCIRLNITDPKKLRRADQLDKQYGYK